MKVNPCVLGAGAAAFLGARLIEDAGRMVEEEDLAEVKRRLYKRALAAMDDCDTWTQGWLKRVAGEMVRECVETSSKSRKSKKRSK